MDRQTGRLRDVRAGYSKACLPAPAAGAVAPEQARWALGVTLYRSGSASSIACSACGTQVLIGTCEPHYESRYYGLISTSISGLSRAGLWVTFRDDQAFR